MFSRVFSLSADPVSPAALAGHLHAAGLPVVPHFWGDDLGWAGGELVLPGGGTPVKLDRWLDPADDLRGTLAGWAAELELMDFSPHAGRLMEHVFRSRQLVSVRRPIDHADEAALDRVVDAALRFLATNSEGVYQADGRGWFAADGALLIPDY